MGIRNEILKIVVRHDVFDFPLTGEEVWGELKTQNSKLRTLENISLDHVTGQLRGLVEEGNLEKEEVFYCLKGRREIIGQRKIRYPVSLRKMMRAKRWIKIFLLLPFMKKIYIAGTVADQNAKHSSDIDLVVETSKGRLWTARFFLNALLTVLNKRPRPGKTRDMFCTSFFYDETFVPESIMPDDLVFQRWIGGRIQESCIMYHVSCIKNAMEFFFGLIRESLFRLVQIRLLMPKVLREANGKGGELDVYFDNRVAKFHLNNRRMEFNQEFQKKLTQYHLTF